MGRVVFGIFIQYILFGLVKEIFENVFVESFVFLMIIGVIFEQVLIECNFILYFICLEYLVFDLSLIYVLVLSG